MNGQANLARLAVAVRRGRPLPGDVAEWLLAGLEEFDRTGDLAGALRLHSTRAARQARNDHLREAGRILGTATPATIRARRILRTGRTLAAFIDEPESVDRVVGNGWQRQVWLAMLHADLPGFSRVRQLMP